MAIIHEKGPGGRGGRSTRAQSTALFLDLVGKRILDTGCKEGYNSFDLAELGAAEVVGIELRENFLEEARAEKARQHFDNVQFVVADARRIDEAGLGSFDICLCTGLLYHMQDPVDLLLRLGKMCQALVLETHVSLPLPLMPFIQGKYRQHLEWKQTVRVSHGECFTGRRNVFPASVNMSDTSGSVDSHETFWLDQKSLRTAVQLAGFRIQAYYCGPFSKAGPRILVDHGINRAKVFLVATKE